MIGVNPALAELEVCIGKILHRLTCRTLVMIADDAVTPEHVISFYQAVPDAELAVVPGTSHGLPVEESALRNKTMLNFLNSEPVATPVPGRRA